MYNNKKNYSFNKNYNQKNPVINLLVIKRKKKNLNFIKKYVSVKLKALWATVTELFGPAFAKQLTSLNV